MFVAHCRSYALEAERKMGEMLLAGKQAGTVRTKGRHPKSNHTEPLELKEISTSLPAPSEHTPRLTISPLSYTYGGMSKTKTGKNPMDKGKFIAYYRVSTDRQGRSGLGLDAQRKAVLDWLNGGNWSLVAEYTEVESGKRSDRPELEKALNDCKRRGASLVIARLDRLARNVHFISGLMERKVPFVAVEFPDATPLMLHIHAAMAEHERKLISERTKAGLEQARLRGVKLGSHGKILARQNRDKARALAKELRPVIKELRKAGKTTVREVMEELNARGLKTQRGGLWHPHTVNVLLHRINRTKPKVAMPVL